MKLDRRDLLLSGPAAILGFQIAEALRAQDTGAPPVDPKVVDFWVNQVRLPASSVVGGAATRGRKPSGPEVGDYGREPLFLFHDSKQGALLTQDQVGPDRLLASGNTNVTIQLRRMRLNDEDDAKFKEYSSGGIYLDLAQAPAPTGGSGGGFEELASSVFSAVFPLAAKSGGSGKKNNAKGGGGTAGKQGSRPTAGGGTPSKGGPTAAAGAAGGGTALPLQQAKQAQSISLPNGGGRHSFACFAKDRRKTLFGKFVDVFSELTSAAGSYLPMLSLPAVAVSSLTAVRSLVANLQAHGENQQWIMMSAPIDVATTKAAAQDAPDALRLPAGDYVLIPKEHSDAFKPQLDQLKVLDGFLVPKDAKALDVYDAYAKAAPGVTYITVSVGVQAAKSKTG